MGFRLFHPRQLRPQFGAPRLVLALRQIAHDEQVAQPAELPLDRLPLPVAFSGLRSCLAVRREDADLRVVG